MWVPGFGYVFEENLAPLVLKGGSVVIDAQNFFYDCYENYKLSYEYGAECDKYADCLKKYLAMFNDAEVKCYFIFKGGTENLKKKILKEGNQQGSKNIPIFATDVHLEVLEEMGFDFFFSEFECKDDCIALAGELSCPVISKDKEFPLRGVQYIQKDSLEPSDNGISCKLFSIDKLLVDKTLDKDKLSLFILLTDVNLFPRGTFDSYLNSKRIPTTTRHKYKPLLQFISKHSVSEILREVRNCTGLDKEVSYKLEQVKKMVKGDSKSASNYFNGIEIKNWFARAVAKKHIVKDYIDIYRSNVLYREVYDDEFMQPSLTIIKYAYDLLTGFENDRLRFVRLGNDTMITETLDKPQYDLHDTYFIHDWDKIRSLGLFQYFIKNTTKFDCNNLDNVPDDAKLLMITLLYMFHYWKLCDDKIKITQEIAHSVLLSHVVLGVVRECVKGASDDKSLSKADCQSALEILEKYFTMRNVDTYPFATDLEQFQYCLFQLNNLNRLCGSPFKPTRYSKTYNGIFVYWILTAMQQNNEFVSIKTDLKSKSPTVFEYYNNIVQIYDDFIEYYYC